jgi:hypothetical protein
VNRGARAAYLLVVLIVLATTIHAAAASPRTRLRYYAGETSQGESIRFTVAVRAGIARLRELELEGSVTCEDGTGFPFGAGIGFGGFSGPRIVDEQLELQDVFFDFGTVISGRLGAHRGSGTVTQAFAALDAEEQAQVCSTGELTWQVERLPTPAPDRMSRVVLIMRADGVRRWTALDPGVRAQGALQVGRARHYRGRTSADGMMQLVTVRRDADVALRRIGFGWHLPCEDGSSVDIGIFFLFGGGLPMDPGRLDLDEVFGNVALHVHGDLGPHLGSGTASQAFAVLTPDLDAQLCSSGEVTWEAWRTDAGF